MKEVQLAFRSLRRSPGFTMVAVLTLALGIGANTAIFTVVQRVLLKPLDFEESERLVRFWSQWHQFPRWVDLGARIFALLRANALLGRTLTPEDDQPGAEPAVVLSYGCWQSSLGGRRGAIGETVELEGEPFTVVGVMPEGFTYPDADTDLWLATRLDRANLRNRGAHNYQGIARLKSGIALEQAQAGMSAIAARLQEQYPNNYPDGSGWGVILVPLFEHTVGAARPALIILLGAVEFVLLIACANVANLTLVRATARDRELKLRVALGAGRARLVTGLLVESASVAALGLGAGLGVARGALSALMLIGPEAVPRLGEAVIDARVLAASVAATLLTILIFGVGARDPLTFAAVALVLTLVAVAACYIPARRAARVDPMIALRYELARAEAATVSRHSSLEPDAHRQHQPLSHASSMLTKRPAVVRASLPAEDFGGVLFRPARLPPRIAEGRIDDGGITGTSLSSNR